MKILWLTWKDRHHPLAGGAEVMNQELAQRLAAEGHQVKLIVGGFAGGKPQEKIDNYTIIRLGNRFSLYLKTWRYYRRHLIDWPDLVIDEVNTMPFMAKWYIKQPNLLFVHMLCRQIWFYQLFFPFSMIGYILEPIYLRLLADRRVITVSNSTKQDLLRHRFKASNIKIISVGIELKPATDIRHLKKYSQPTILSLGTIKPMKRTHHQLKAFELAKSQIPDLRLKIAGDSNSFYGRRLLRKIRSSPYAGDIEYIGKANQGQKIELMQKSHLLCVTSVKEGWCLVVTEAASQGTPAVAYSIDGLRDSIRNGYTGLLCEDNTPTDLAAKVVDLLNNKERYQTMRQRAWEWNKRITFDRSYREFKSLLSL